MKLSVVVPMYNEERYIRTLLGDLINALEPMLNETEVLVIDDGSSDSSKRIVNEIVNSKIKLLCLPQNSGKGAAVRFGIMNAIGTHVLVQDADLEYDPKDIGVMLEKLSIRGNENVAVYGSRIHGAREQIGGWRGAMGLWPDQGVPQRLFNFILSLFHYLISRVWISDLLTGYKIYPSHIFKDWETVTTGFETDHEITMQLHKLDVEILEVPVSYRPRSKAMGKKITGKDAIKAVSTLWKFR